MVSAQVAQKTPIITPASVGEPSLSSSQETNKEEYMTKHKMTMSPYVIDLRSSYAEATGQSVDNITSKKPLDYEAYEWAELEASLDFAKPRKSWFKLLKK